MTNEKVITNKDDYHELCTILDEIIEFANGEYDAEHYLIEMKRLLGKAEPYKEDN